MKIYDAQGRQVTTNEVETLEFYETNWVACSDWTNQHLGTTAGGNVIHNLNTPLRNLMVKVFISEDGTDDNSYELIDSAYVYNEGTGGVYDRYGLTIFAVDDDNLVIQTGINGVSYVANADGNFTAIGGAQYYRIVVYKMVTVPRVYSGIPKYDTGWIACSDWTNQLLGTALGGAVTHSLSTPLPELLVQVFISSSSDGANAIEIMAAKVTNTVGTFGITKWEIDDNSLNIQTGAQGVTYFSGSGTIIIIDTESWYYKIKVWKLG